MLPSWLADPNWALQALARPDSAPGRAPPLPRSPLKKWEADRMNQAANVQIFLSLMGAMALKTQQARVLDCACRVALARTRALMTILWPWKRACHKCLWAVWPAEANTPALPLSPVCLLDAPVHSPPGAGGFV